MDRRDLLKGAAATTVTIGVGSVALSAGNAPAQSTSARSAAHTPEGQQALLAYRQAVDVMQNRPPLDPTSWVYQSLIHGIVTEQPRAQFLQAVFGGVSSTNPQRQLAEATWATCPHASLDFLAWHRLYIYFFERITRQASGDSQFALPYWDYSMSVQTAILPAAFREAVDGSPLNNSLFSLARSPELNGLFVAPEPLVSTDVGLDALTEPQFEAGSQNVGFSEALENIPHNVIHGTVGGGDTLGTPLGDMSSTRTAARDPVFWVHHCNIDRLWESWLDAAGETASDYSDRNWYTRRWTFVDETGTRQDVSMQDLESELIGGAIRYDRLENIPRVQLPLVAVASEATTFSQSLGGATVLSAKGNTIRIDARAPLTAGNQENLTSARIVLNGVTTASELAVTFDVYLAFLDAVDLTPQEPIGAFSFFGSRHMGHSASKRYVFDVTEEVRRAMSDGSWPNGARVTILPRAPFGVEAATIESITIEIN